MTAATVQMNTSHTAHNHTARNHTAGRHTAQTARLDAAVYHRRRTVAAILAATIIVVVFGAGSAALQRVTGSPGLPSAGADIEEVAYIVQPGDTVWGIAESLSPEGADVRLMVDAVRASAGGVALSPGQKITVPQAQP